VTQLGEETNCRKVKGGHDDKNMGDCCRSAWWRVEGEVRGNCERVREGMDGTWGIKCREEGTGM